MSHIICISPIDGNHINTKTKIHHALAQEAPPLPKKPYDVHRPYDELLPSHIRGQFVNPKNYPIKLYMTYTTKTSMKFPSFDPHTLKKAQKYAKGIKNP